MNGVQGNSFLSTLEAKPLPPPSQQVKTVTPSFSRSEYHLSERGKSLKTHIYSSLINMEFRRSEVSESRIDEIAEQLFNKVLEKYTASQRVPTLIELAGTVKEEVGVRDALKCAHWMEKVYRTDLIDMGYSLPSDNR